jgi:hypothetical protein
MHDGEPHDYIVIPVDTPHPELTALAATWLTDDRCDGTLTRVTQGSVTIRDLVRKRNVVLSAPKSYVARAK